MTEKLFYKDVRGCEFDAEVRDCRKKENRYEIILDRTYFYPEGGGQPADHGTLGEAAVFDVQDEDGEVAHYTDKAIEPGTRVHGKIDMLRRHSLTQQHSGEHIVSGLIHNRFGYDNVGFHMGSECITIDFNGPLTAEDLEQIEKEANEIIYADFEPSIFYPSKEELDRLEYRSKKELEGDVRIVSFGNCDTCACCGLHVVRTGEIGVIKITGFQKYKGGTRVTMLAGRQARGDYAVKDRINHAISGMLSSKPYDIQAAVERLMSDRNDIKEQLVETKKKLFALKRDCLEKDTKCAVLFEDNMEPFDMRVLTETLLEKVPSAAVLCRDSDSGYRYCVGSRTADVQAFVKEANKALEGRGGGRGAMAQGTFASDAEAIERFIRNAMD
mgnify:CR=1 FL=1